MELQEQAGEDTEEEPERVVVLNQQDCCNLDSDSRCWFLEEVVAILMEGNSKEGNLSADLDYSWPLLDCIE